MLLKRIGSRQVSQRVRNSERGQVLVLFVALFTVLLVAAAFSIDQGMWVGHRRVAQKDADTAARGGAMAFLASQSNFSQAESQARLVATQNGVPFNTDTKFTAHHDCDGVAFSANDVPSITAQINEPAPSLFSLPFLPDGIKELGATATACVGQPSGLSGSDPLYVGPDVSSPDPKCFDSDGNPKIGSICPIMVPSGYVDTGSRGLLSLQDDPLNVGNNETVCTQPTGSNVDLEIAAGVNAQCVVGDFIFTKQGSLSNIKGALHCRVEGYAKVGTECPNGARSAQVSPGEGACDSGFHVSGTKIPPFATTLTPAFLPADVINSPAGLDDFQEVFSTPPPGGTPPTSLTGSQFLVPNVCNGRTSPRILNIIVTTGKAVNGIVYVKGFATFYLLGCRDIDGPNSTTFQGQIDPYCDNINTARTALVGIFVRAYLPEAGGPLTECGSTCTSKTIVLVR
jgi:hypothetical protein